MIKNYLSVSFLAIGMSALPMLAHADLLLTNNTALDATAMVNDKDCSVRLLGELGITHKNGGQSYLSDMALRIACHDTKDNCKADLYMSIDCNYSGAPKVATVYYSINTGLKSITILSDDYQIVGDSHALTLNGGPKSLFDRYTKWFF